MTSAGGESRSALVLDAMCLNHFARVDRLDVLQDLLFADKCYTTYVVLDEIRQGLPRHPELQDVLETEWIEVIRFDSPQEVECFEKWIGRVGSGDHDLGEASVFVAAELRDCTAITDDQAATRVARKFGLDVHGTVWLLGRACHSGKLTVTAAGNLIDMLRTTGMRLPCTGPEFEPWARERGLL